MILARTAANYLRKCATPTKVPVWLIVNGMERGCGAGDHVGFCDWVTRRSVIIIIIIVLAVIRSRGSDGDRMAIPQLRANVCF